MSSEKSINDLRAALDQHAEDVVESVATARVAAVRARVVRVRRRQAGAVVGAAAAVVAVVAAATVLPGGEAPSPAADRQLLGLTAPAQMSALGYTYEFDRGTDSSDGASAVELEASDEPRLLTWAADDSVKLVDPGDEVRVSDAVAFDDWLVVPPGASGTWTAHANESALAVYTLTDDRPAGTTVDGITFREDVAGDLLVAAGIGEPGQSEVTIDVTVPESGLTRYATLCQSGTGNAWVHVDFGPDLGEFVTGPGCDDSPFDPGARGTSSALGPRGEVMPVTIYATRGENGARIGSADLRLGLAAYDVAEPTATVAGHDLAELQEQDGHLWQYGGQVAAQAGTPTLSYVNDESDSELVLAGFDRAGDTTVRLRSDSQGDVSGSSGNGLVPFVLAPGQRAAMDVSVPVPDAVLLGYAFYSRAD